jgi:tetratricopeptide (TPR) repeat protein
VNAHTGLGFALIEKGSNNRAVKAFQKTLQLDPRQADAHAGLGNALNKLGEIDRAVESYQQALKLDPGNLNALNGLGDFNSSINELDKAIGYYQAAIDIDPAHKESFKNLAETLSDHGRLDEALDYCRKAIAVDSGYTEAYRLLSRIRKFSEYDADIQAMQSLFEKDGISDSDKMKVAFGLGKACEDIGDYEKSMNFILEATRLKRSTFSYSTRKSQEFFERIKQVYSRDFFSAHEAQGNPDATPIFILGMPRSGTSLVEQILASHPEVHGGGERLDLIQIANRANDRHASSNTDEFPELVTRLEPRDLRELGYEYVSRIRKLSADARFITDKLPHNFLRIGFIRVILPNARIINCCRDPMDNCLSIFKNYFSIGHDYSYDLTELGQYYNLYLDLMRHWNSTLPGFIYELSYEDLVFDQEKQIRQLLEHCHLPWDDACLDFHRTERLVKTASNVQVRQPIYKDSVKGWKHYEKQLKPLADLILC